jgi:cardiolipin synthase
VILTTPYFIPSASLLAALLSATGRGVAVTLIVLAKGDSHLVHYVSRAFQGDLLAAGVRIALFTRGLLHKKSITVEGRGSLFGSLNYDAAFTAALRQLQQSNLDKFEMLDLAACRARSATQRFKAKTARLVGPIL